MGSIVKSYINMKNTADQIRYEFTNQDTIVLRQNGAFHVAVGHSVLILKILGAKTKVHSVYDKLTKQDVYEMSIHSSRMEDTKKFLQEIGSEILRDSGGFYVVRLKNPPGAKTIQRARKSDQIRSEVAGDMLQKHRQKTPVAKEVRMVFEEVSMLAGTMKSPENGTLGKIILERTLDLQQAIRSVTRTQPIDRDLVQRVDDISDDILGLLLLTPDFGQHAARLTRIGRSLNTIRGALMTKSTVPS